MNLNLQTLSVVSLACAALSFVGMAIALVFVKRAHRDARDTLALALSLEADNVGISRDIDTLTVRVTDQARRVAWLESRVRSRATNANTEEKPEEASVDAVTAAKPTITERRHRVLTLARRGQDSKQIAEILGVPHGEVELIIGLSKAA